MDKIQVINRHCFSSSISANKERPEWFSREKCFTNLLKTIDFNLAQLHIIYDNKKGEINNHFLSNYPSLQNINIISDGTGAGSFLKSIDYVLSCNFNDDTIIYFLEDDYLSRKNWCQILIEGIKILEEKFKEKGFISLYSHPDKMDERVYPNLFSRIFTSNSCYWRTTPSTTDTFACTVKTLKSSLKFFKFFSTDVKISRDHERFVKLGEFGYNLITPIPSWATHCETAYLGKTINWEKVIND